MSDILGKAVDFGKDAAAIGIRAGGMIVDKGIDLRSSLGGNAKFFEEADEKDTEIKKLLDGSNDRQKLEGMKKLIAVRGLSSHSRHCSYHPASLRGPFPLPFWKVEIEVW